MKECMPTDKPRIAILMAVYDPNMRWFQEQLESLNAQTYPNLHLYVRDDCSPHVPFAQIEAMVTRCVTAFPCTVRRNDRNAGSNLTFQYLTQEAEGDLFAYCDQDDVWLPEKLEVMAQDARRTGALLVCSDVAVIDGEGSLTANSITELRRRCVMHSGDDLAGELLLHNFVFGCASLVDAKTAKAAVPFCPHYYHDHYLTLFCAEQGSIYAQPKALIRYRIHGSNQTGLMSGVKDKRSYEAKRIQTTIDQMQWLQAHFPCCAETKARIEDALQWAEARQSWWLHGRSLATVWKHRRLGMSATAFELVMARMPEKVLMLGIDLIRKNKI